MNNLRIPNYRIYGEDDPGGIPEITHCEMIEDRSSIHKWKIKPHRHGQIHQFFYSKEGGVKAVIDGVEFNHQAPFFISIPALSVHEFIWKEQSKGVVINVHATEIAKSLSSVPQLATLLFSQANFISKNELDSEHEQFVGGLFYRCLREYRSSEPIRSLMMDTLLSQIYIGLGRPAMNKSQTKEAEKSKAEILCSNLIELIDKHYIENRNASYYSDILGVTISKLNRVTQKIVGQSFHELLKRRLLTEAKRNIIYTSMSAKQISYALGFNDPAYFCRFFKKYTGLTPSEFRKKA